MTNVKKTSLLLIAILLVTSMILSGCGKNSAEAGGAKLAWYASAPHPYFEEVKKGVEAFEKDTGIKVEKQIGPDWTQPSETQNLEALAAKNYKYFAVYPSDGSGANGVYEELTKRGIKIINFGASTVQPTTASLYVGTDVKMAAMEAAEALIKLMGGKGNIINVLEVLEDSNTILRKQGIEEVLKKYPDVKIVQEISGMKSTEDAIEKVDSAIAANIEKVDGIIATGFTPTVAIAQVMQNYKNKGGKRIIHSIGMDTDPIVVKAIKDGVMDATIAQNPYGHGYLSMLLLQKMSEGWKPKKGVYAMNAGTIVVTKNNIDTFQDEIMKVTNDMKATLESKYLEK